LLNWALTFFQVNRAEPSIQLVGRALRGYGCAMSLVLEENFAGVWERTIQPEERGLTPDAARYFMSLEFTDADRARMNDLAAKARAGPLSEAEQAELGNFMQLGWFLDLLKSKARLSLGIRPADA
jgi:hypothetical protein